MPVTKKRGSALCRAPSEFTHAPSGQKVNLIVPFIIGTPPSATLVASPPDENFPNPFEEASPWIVFNGAEVMFFALRSTVVLGLPKVYHLNGFW